MELIKYNCRTFPHRINGSVIIRVRWNNKKSQTEFATGCFADISKWNLDSQCANKNSTHVVGDHTTPARIINKRISECLTAIEDAFYHFTNEKHIPTTKELREQVLPKITIEKPTVDNKNNEKPEEESIDEIFAKFLEIRPAEATWGEKTHCKYNQMFKHLKSCDSNIQLSSMNKEFLNKLKVWYINGEYHNATITKHFRNLKGFANWAKANGYTVHDDVFTYKTNISVPKKRVIFLTFEELMHFNTFQFPEGKNYLERARDLFCFMAFTSLRYSDMSALRKSNINGSYIEIYTEKTDDMLKIPITSYAQKIIDKYKDNYGDKLFQAPSNQKLNDYIKEAAELAELNREVVETFYVGKTKHETTQKLYETISCHDARRTFVCCSLRFGMTPTVVMACTGHADYESMRPYIEVASETTQKEMQEKWENRKQKDEIIAMLDNASDEVLELIINILKKGSSA